MMNRRHFLRAAGVTLGLPFLESLAKAAQIAPQRFAFIYTPNGYNQAAFLPKTTGANWELTPTLSPLAKVKNDITLVTGLDRQFVGGTGVGVGTGVGTTTGVASAPLATGVGAGVGSGGGNSFTLIAESNSLF